MITIRLDIDHAGQFGWYLTSTFYGQVILSRDDQG